MTLVLAPASSSLLLDQLRVESLLAVDSRIKSMTQFIIVTGDPSVDAPPGIGLRPVEEDSFAARTVSHLLSGYRGHLFKVVGQESGEADRLIDGIYNAAGAGDSLEEPLLRFLQALVTQGHSVACWYGNDVSDVPVFRTWEAFVDAVLRDATEQPPEVYAAVQPIGGPDRK